MAESVKKINLKTVDGDVFDVEPEVAKEIGTVQIFIDADSTDDDSAIVIPLPNVFSSELSRILEYCNSHREFHLSGNKKMAEEYDKAFIEAMTPNEMKDLTVAAHYLNVKKLLDFLTQAIADHIADKSVEYVRKYFIIENDFTPEEEAKIREENAWAFEGINDEEYED